MTARIGRCIALLSLCVTLAACASSGLGDVPEPERRVAEMAEANDPDAQTAIGIMFERGLGMRPDIDRALEWYRRAAAQGDPLAEFHIGSLYERGLVVAQDYAEAAAWYRRAAEGGSDAAQAALAYLYEKGFGVEQDYAEAVKLYDAAAMRWHARARYPLDSAYATGEGVAPASLVLVRPGTGGAVASDERRVVEINLSTIDRLAPAEPGLVAPVRAPKLRGPPAAEAGSASDAVGAPQSPLGGSEDDARRIDPTPSAAERSALERLAGRIVAPAVGGAVSVHLANFFTPEDVIREWERLRHEHEDLLGELGYQIERVDLSGAFGFLMLTVDPIESPDVAEALCAALKSRGQFCELMGG